MKKIALFGVALVVTMAFTGCSVKTGNERLETMSNQNVGEQITKGVSTKLQVKDMLGEPQNVDFMSNGLEKWEYKHLRKTEKGINYVPVVNWFVKGTDDTTKTLVVLFKGDVVENYAVSTALGETKGGLLQ